MRQIYLTTILSIIILVISLPWEQGMAQDSKPDPIIEIATFQKEIVASLTGYQTSAITPRSTPEERKEAVDYLYHTFNDIGLEPVFHNYRMPNVNGFVDLLFPPYKGVNMYFTLEAATQTSEYIIVGAHFDSEPDTPGAVDNASGVAVTLSLAHTLSKTKERRINYLFVLFDQEEDDEVGSKAFVKYLKDKSYNIHSVHIIDSIGWGSADTLSFEVQTSDSVIAALYRNNANKFAISMNVTGGAGASDNKSFNQAGYPTAGFWDDELTPHLHKTSDTYGTINFKRLHSATTFLLEMLTELGGD